MRTKTTRRAPITHTAKRAADGGVTHRVRLEIKVLLTHEEGTWTAEGLEIYFVAQGATLAEAKDNFVRGIVGTIRLNLGKFGNLRSWAQPAPPELWREFNAALERSLDVTHERLPHLDVPYGQIAYVQNERAASHAR